jgi:RimJ/RimL family protein N-acetyltransferase
MRVGNEASARVAHKVGFTFEGVRRGRLFLHGAARDARMFGLVLAHLRQIRLALAHFGRA